MICLVLLQDERTQVLTTTGLVVTVSVNLLFYRLDLADHAVDDISREGVYRAGK